MAIHIAKYQYMSYKFLVITNCGNMFRAGFRSPCQTSKMKFFANKRSAWIRLLLLPRNIWNQSFSQRPLTRKLSGIRFCSTMIVMQMWPELICVCFIWKKKVELTITISVQISRSCVATGTLFKRILIMRDRKRAVTRVSTSQK